MGDFGVEGRRLRQEHGLVMQLPFVPSPASAMDSVIPKNPGPYAFIPKPKAWTEESCHRRTLRMPWTVLSVPITRATRAKLAACAGSHFSSV